MKTPSSSRIIGAEHLSDVRPFTLADIAARRTKGGVRRDTAAPAELQKDQWADDPGFQAGRVVGQREGFQQGIESARRQAALELEREQANAIESLSRRVAGLGDAFAIEFAEIERTIADELIELAIELARQTVRQSLRIDRDAIVTVVNEAISALIDERANFVVHLNPADAEIVSQALGAALEPRGGRLMPDRSIATGGCKVLSGGAEIDATVGTRWRRVLASIGHDALPGDPLCND